MTSKQKQDLVSKFLFVILLLCISFSFFQFGTISALHTLSALQNNTRSQSSFPATQNDEISEFQLRMCINKKNKQPILFEENIK